MKKLIGLILALALVFTLGVTFLGCATTPTSTTPAGTTPPATTTPTPTITPTPTDPKPTQVPGTNTAVNFIKNSPTFKFDGIEDSIKLVKAEDGTTSSFKSIILTFEYQTRQPGHGDRSGQMLAQVITFHTVTLAVDLDNNTIKSAICDNNWDMLANKTVATTISGVVISGGDTTPAGGPQDAPRTFVYKIQKEGGTFVSVSYVAYPPSPSGDAARAKINLHFRGGSILIGDHMEAKGTYDKETNTLFVAKEGDYIYTLITQETAQILAADFIKNSSTFKFDGISGSLKLAKTEPGWASSFRSTVYTFDFENAHPGYGDRTGQVLAQVITKHTAVVMVNIDKGIVASAICDGNWDMINQKELPVMVSGTVISGGDTTPADGPTDAPRTFVYKVQKSDGTYVNVSYVAYPPSPVGDANMAKIKLEFANGAVNFGDRLEARGSYNKESNTVLVANEGDYIKTMVQKVTVLGLVISGGDTTPAGSPQDAPRKFVYKIEQDDHTFINVSYTAYPPSPAGDAANAKIGLSLYNSSIQAGDYLKAQGVYDKETNTVVVADQGDFIKTYPQKP